MLALNWTCVIHIRAHHVSYWVTAAVTISTGNVVRPCMYCSVQSTELSVAGTQARSQTAVSVCMLLHWLGLKTVNWFWLQLPVRLRRQSPCLAINPISNGAVVDHLEELFSMFQQYMKMRCLVTGRGSSSLTMSMRLDCDTILGRITSTHCIASEKMHTLSICLYY